MSRPKALYALFGLIAVLATGKFVWDFWFRLEPLPDPPSRLVSPPAQPQAEPSTPPKFSAVLYSDGEGDDGSQFSDELLETPRGTRLTRRIEYFTSVAAARKGMRETAQESEIVRHASDCGTAADTARERAVLRQKASSGETPFLTITWRDGTTVYSIWAKSLDDALELEREVYPCARP